MMTMIKSQLKLRNLYDENVEREELRIRPICVAYIWQLTQGAQKLSY